MDSRHSLSAAALSIVATVLPVSGFAQTDGSMQAVLVRTSSSVVRPYVEDHTPSHEIAALPANMLVSDHYREIVETMRRRSPTFRRQCARIARTAALSIVIQTEPPSATRRAAAWTHVARYEGGLMRATVRVAIRSRAPELIAHELEHVLEQLDGVDLAAKARLPRSGVHVCNCGDVTAFETVRAVAAGLRVADELARD